MWHKYKTRQVPNFTSQANFSHVTIIVTEYKIMGGGVYSERLRCRRELCHFPVGVITSVTPSLFTLRFLNSFGFNENNPRALMLIAMWIEWMKTFDGQESTTDGMDGWMDGWAGHFSSKTGVAWQRSAWHPIEEKESESQMSTLIQSLRSPIRRLLSHLGYDPLPRYIYIYISIALSSNPPLLSLTKVE